MVVADAVAVGGDAERRHALHEAGGEAAEAAIAERRVGLDLAQLVEIDVETGERRAHRLDQPQIGEGVDQQPADQEFQREIIDPATALAVIGAHRGHPVVHREVARGERHGDEPVALAGGVLVLADGIDQLLQHSLAQPGGRGLAENDLGLRGFVQTFGRSGDGFGHAVFLDGDRAVAPMVSPRAALCQRAFAREDNKQGLT